MNQKYLFSIRMRASTGGRHVSGAERIVSGERIDVTVQELVMRAREKDRVPDQIVVTIDSLGDILPRTLTALDVVTLESTDVISARSVASRLLQTAGVSEQAAEVAIHNLSKGAAPSGGNMRGAIIMDSLSGERLESDQERGIRVSRIDWSEDASRKIQERLHEIGLTHFRTREAIALATKVAQAPGVVAELCWSDEPDYTAGYIASLGSGYIRFPALKRKGDPNGGRVFFVDKKMLDMVALVRYLQTETVLIADVGDCKSAPEPDTYV
jgi:6-carboxyhexanoate--CoA ligase